MKKNIIAIVLVVMLLAILPAASGQNMTYLETVDPAGDVWFDVNQTDEFDPGDVDIIRVSCDSSDIPYILEMSVMGKIRLKDADFLYNYTFKLIRKDGDRDNVFITSDVEWDSYPYPIIPSVTGDGTSLLRVEFDPRLIEVEDGIDYVVEGIMAEASIFRNEEDIAYDLINSTMSKEEVEIVVTTSSWRYVRGGSGMELEARVEGTSSGGMNIWVGWSCDFNDGYVSSIQWYRSLFNNDGQDCTKAHLVDTSPDGDLTSFEFLVLCENDSSEHSPFKDMIEEHEGLRTVYAHIVIFPSDEETVFSQIKVNVKFESSYRAPDQHGQKEEEEFPWVFPAIVGALILAGILVWWKDRKEELENGP